MGDVIERRYAARGAALEVFHRRESEVLICGAAGTGKSRAVLEKIHMVCLLTPGTRALIVRRTHVSLTETGLVTFREHVAAEALAAGFVHWYGGSGDKPPAYMYSNGSAIAVGGMDKPTKIMSSEYDLIFVQEATELTLTSWEALSTRLRNGRLSFQQLIADCNPVQPSHWLKKRCDDGATVMLHARHEDNPVLFGGDGALTERGVAYIARLDALTGVRKLRLRHGKWAAAEGIIYEGWQPEVHLSDRKMLPKEWVRVWAVDFGFIHPFVWQQWAVDPDGRLWLELEIHRTKRLVEDHARDILRAVIKAQEWERVEKEQASEPPLADGESKWAAMGARAGWKYPKPRVVICDHDAEDRATLERHLGMGTIAAWKSVSDGIQACQQRLKIQPDGKPRVYVLRTSLVERDMESREAGQPTCFSEEVESYVWRPAPAAVLGREKPPPDEPDKVRDDSMDTWRYVVAEHDLASRPRVRWLG